jgi:hypothetical protein
MKKLLYDDSDNQIMLIWIRSWPGKIKIIGSMGNFRRKWLGGVGRGIMQNLLHDERMPITRSCWSGSPITRSCWFGSAQLDPVKEKSSDHYQWAIFDWLAHWFNDFYFTRSTRSDPVHYNLVIRIPCYNPNPTNQSKIDHWFDDFSFIISTWSDPDQRDLVSDWNHCTITFSLSLIKWFSFWSNSILRAWKLKVEF